MPTIAYRATRKRQKFVKAPQVKSDLADALDNEVKPKLLQRFQHVVANWQHKPIFKARKFIRIDRIWVDVFPTGENAKIWLFVTGGTKPHPIRAKRAPRLAFMWGGHGSYKPKTRPVGKFGGPGIVVGGTLHRPIEVQHPGTEAREFEKAIRDDFRKDFSRIMNNAFRRAIRRL